MTAQRQPLNWGRVGALLDMGVAALFAGLLFVATGNSADVVPRPLFLGVLYAVPGLVGLIGALTGRAWLLVAGALPLIPGVFLSFTGITLIFLFPAAFMLLGALTTQPPPGEHRIGVITGLAALAIAALIVAAGWVALFGMSVSACSPTPGGEVCGDRMISSTGLIVALICLAAALGIAAVGGGLIGKSTKPA